MKLRFRNGAVWQDAISRDALGGDVLNHSQPMVETSPAVSDEIRKTTCYMCACRCGINVHMKDGKVAYIEGNRDHPVNKGVLCAKGSAGSCRSTRPSRLRAPLKRVGPRGSGQFEEISWDEALDIATWLKPIRKTALEKLAFFTGRDQSQSFTSFWAQNFGTPNFAAHGGFCSVNMAAGWHLHDGRRLLGIWAAGLGAYEAFHDVRRGRGP
jgi:anaerobic selenocysteine-containing dehydrogenase